MRVRTSARDQIVCAQFLLGILPALARVTSYHKHTVTECRVTSHQRHFMTGISTNESQLNLLKSF